VASANGGTLQGDAFDIRGSTQVSCVGCRVLNLGTGQVVVNPISFLATSCTNVTFVGCSIEDTLAAPSGTRAAFWMNISTKCTVVGGTINITNGRAFNETGASNNNVYTGNTVTTSQASTIIGANSKLFLNPGETAVTQNAGVTGAIATLATVAHGLSVTPTTVLLTAQDGTPTAVFPSVIGATTFTVNYTGGGTHAFAWSAQ